MTLLNFWGKYDIFFSLLSFIFGNKHILGLVVKRFTEFTVHRGSVVMIRFTVLFLRVSMWLSSQV